MAQTSFAKAYRDEILSKISLAYMNSTTDFIATKVAPFLQVEKDSGQIFSYGKQAMRVMDGQKATGGSYKKVRYTIERTDHYNLKRYGFVGEVLEEDVENVEAPLNAETDTTEMLTGQLMTGMEKRLAGNITTTTITQNVTLSGTSRWSDYTGTSNPFKQITDGITAIAATTGKYANSLVLSLDTLIALKNHPTLIARFKGIDLVTDQNVVDAIGAMFGIKNVYFGNSRELASNQPGNGALSLIWSNMALLYYSEEKPTLKSTSFAKTYAKRDGVEVTKVTQADLAQEALQRDVYSMIRVRNKYDQVLVNTDCAYLIQNTVS